MNKLNIANVLTVVRIILIFPIVYYLLSDDLIFGLKSLSITLVAILYTIGCLTDYYDGYYARKYKLQSSFGKFLDPLADKLFNISIMVTFLYIDNIRLSSFLVIVIIFREVFITFMRIYAIYKDKEIKTEQHGKIKTTIQIVGQSFVLAVVLHNSIIFDMDHFQNNILTSAANASYIHVDLKKFHYILTKIFNYPDWLWNIIEWVPNFFFSIMFYFTVKSGLVYLYHNRNLFNK